MAILTETIQSSDVVEKRTDITPRLAAAAVFVGMVGAASVVDMKPVLLLSVAAMASLGFTFVSSTQPSDKMAENAVRLDIVYAAIAAMVFSAVFQFADNSAFKTVMMFMGAMIAELGISALIVSALSSLNSMPDRAIGIALNIHNRAFGLLGRGI